MVLMDSDTLESRGVAALGARKKLLRVRCFLLHNKPQYELMPVFSCQAFANVREHYNMPHPDWYVPEAVATTGPVNAGAGKDGSGQ